MSNLSKVSAWQLDQNSASAYEQYLVGHFFRRWAERLVAHANVQPGERVLDAGCGTGIVARSVSHTRPDAQVVGLDVNEGMLAEARQQDREGRVRWRCGAIEAMPLEDDSFELVLSQQVLQFVPEWPKALGEMRRVLSPKGRLVFALLRGLDHNPSYQPLAKALDRHVGSEAGNMMRAPFAGPDSETLRSELNAAGFGQVVIQHDILDVRFPSPSEYLRREAASSPLAGTLAGVDGERLKKLLGELDRLLAPFTDDKGVAFPMETRFVLAQ